MNGAILALVIVLMAELLYLHGAQPIKTLGAAASGSLVLTHG